MYFVSVIITSSTFYTKEEDRAKFVTKFQKRHRNQQNMLKARNKVLRSYARNSEIELEYAEARANTS